MISRRKRLLNVSLVVIVLLFAGCNRAETPNDEVSNEPNQGHENELQSRVAPTRKLSGQATEDNLWIEDAPLLSMPLNSGQLVEDGSGLDLVIFASTRRQYLQSLAEIAANTSDKQMKQFETAIRYLLINSPLVMNKEDRLYETIDGKTAGEVIEMAVELSKDR